MALTLACELPLALGWMRLPAPAGALSAALPSAARVLLVSACASLLTHPFAWRVALALPPAQYREGLVGLELGVVAVEAVVYRTGLRLGWRRALGLSLAANAFSAGVGGLLPW